MEPWTGGLSEFHYLTKPIKCPVGFMRLPQEGMALSREDSCPTCSQVRDIRGKLFESSQMDLLVDKDTEFTPFHRAVWQCAKHSQVWLENVNVTLVHFAGVTSDRQTDHHSLCAMLIQGAPPWLCLWLLCVQPLRFSSASFILFWRLLFFKWQFYNARTRLAPNADAFGDASYRILFITCNVVGMFLITSFFWTNYCKVYKHSVCLLYHVLIMGPCTKFCPKLFPNKLVKLDTYTLLGTSVKFCLNSLYKL